MSTLERPVYLSEPECGGVEGQVILRLSSLTNAHAEIASGTNYKEVICYNDIFSKGYTVANPTICNGKNLVLKLSGQTNAHAEIASGTNYAVNVCYGDIQECELVKTGICPGEKRAIVRLSSDTNAHLEKPGLNNYDNVICCKISSAPGPVPPGAKACNNKKDDDGDGKIDYPNDPGCASIDDDDEKDSIPPAVKGKAYWADEKGVEFEKNKNKANIGDTVTLVVTGVLANAKVNFVIWDKDLALLDPDDEIKGGIKADADDKGVAKSSWKISKEDYDKGGNEADNLLELYFIASAESKDLRSEILYLNNLVIPPPEEVGCSKYNDASYVKSLKNEPSQKTACDDDLGGQLKKDPLYSASNCGEEITVQGKKIKVTCACKWEDNKCNFSKSTKKIDFPPKPGGVICKATCDPIKYEESQCVDNEKTITTKNKLIFDNEKDCKEDEKSSAQEACPEKETQVVPCGSKRLQLPLFEFAQFMISLVMISIVYSLIILRKRTGKKI